MIVVRCAVHFAADFKNRSSTFFLAQGVWRKNFKLDLMLGFSLKHLIGMRFPSSVQPYCLTSWVSIISSVIPCKGLLGWEFAIIIHLWMPSLRSHLRRTAATQTIPFEFRNAISSHLSQQKIRLFYTDDTFEENFVLLRRNFYMRLPISSVRKHRGKVFAKI